MSETKFVELQKKLFSLFEKGNFDEVHLLIHKAQIDFPERLDKTSYWKACVYSTEGKLENAVATLNDTLKKGVWWNPQTLTRDPDLKSLQDLEEFKLIVKKCEDILEKNRLTSKSQLFVYGNQNSDIGVFCLHWRGSNVNDFAPYWFDNNVLNKYLFGFPQSSQVHAFNAYCWDNKDKALDDISEAFSDFKAKHDTKRAILAGASQGGKLSIELFLNANLLDTKGFIAVIPSIQDVSTTESIIKSKKITSVKGCIITGDKDPFYNKTLELMPIFEAHGIQCKLIVKEGLGHFFPDDFTKLLPEAVDYILE